MKKKTPVINLTFYLYFIILCFVGKCLAGNIDISFHFIRGKEADFSSPEEECLPKSGRWTWHFLQKRLIDKLASHCSREEPAFRAHQSHLAHQWLFGSLLLVITFQEFANKVSSCSFTLSHLAGFLSLMDLKLMGPFSLTPLDLWQSQHILGNVAGG